MKVGKIEFMMSCLILLLTIAIQAQTTAFSYQGHLNNGGTPANGNFEMQFKLFDALAGGAQIGGTVTNGSVAVINGSFAVTLDFGAAAFTGGPARYLEIGVRPMGNPNPFTILSPRQPINSTPYSIQARNALAADTDTNALQLGGIAANQYVQTNDSRLSDSRNPLPSSASYIQNQNAQTQASSNFSISGDGMVGGTLSANIVNTTTNYNIGGNRILSIAGTRNTYTGVGAGQANVIGHDSTFFGFNAGFSNTGTGGANAVANFNSFFGVNAGRSDTTGGFNSFFGANAGSSNTTGNTNSFFGVNAGSGNAGDDNSFFGTSAGLINRGNRNSFFGVSAGRQPIFGDPDVPATGDDNAFFGASAGSRNLASGNSFFGSGAGASNTTGSSNSFFGLQAGTVNTSSQNSFYGYASGSKNTSGFQNSFFGSEAGGENINGGQNAFFGHLAGLTNTGGTGNTAIGAFADVNSGLLTNATAIGSNARVEASRTLVLGTSNGLGTNVVIGATGGIVDQEDSRAARLNVFGGPLWTINGWKSAIQMQTAAAIGWGGNGVNAFGIGSSTGGLYFFHTSSRIATTGTSAIYDLQIDDTGLARFFRNCVANGAGSAIAGSCSSDARLKREVTSFPSVLEKVVQLRPVNFYWRQEEFPERAFGPEQSFGLIAQEAEKVLPELVGEDADGYKTINYTKLPLLLLQAVKDLKAENDALNERLNAFKVQQARIEAQQRQIDALTKLLCATQPQAKICREKQ